MFDSSGRSIFNLSNRYPVDIHDIAQGILVFSLAQGKTGQGLEDALRGWNFARDHMKKKNGTYKSRIYRKGTSKTSGFQVHIFDTFLLTCCKKESRLS